MKLRAALGAIALLRLLAGCGAGKFADEAAPLTTQDAPSTSTPPSSTAGIVPTGIRIPSIAVNNRQFMQVGLAGDRSLEVPPLNMPKLMAWFKLSPLPGDSALCSFADGCVQPAVIVSHVDGNGVQGGFSKLSNVKVGASVEIDRSDSKTAVFKVTRTKIFKKTTFSATDVYGGAGPSLTLISCGPGVVVAGSYLNQTVVTASLVELKPTNP